MRKISSAVSRWEKPRDLVVRMCLVKRDKQPLSGFALREPAGRVNRMWLIKRDMQPLGGFATREASGPSGEDVLSQAWQKDKTVHKCSFQCVLILKSMETLFLQTSEFWDSYLNFWNVQIFRLPFTYNSTKGLRSTRYSSTRKVNSLIFERFFFSWNRRLWAAKVHHLFNYPKYTSVSEYPVLFVHCYLFW